MNAFATILATAAVAAGSVQAIRALRKRFAEAPDHVQWLKKRRSNRQDGVLIDLEAGADGVFKMPPRT